jgi:uncharacterized protein (TIGR04222 family)
MLDWFIAIKGQDFLVYFWTFSILVLLIGKWLVNRIDGSKYFAMPSPTQLNAYEIAALREERKGVIHTALFNLWNEKLIEVSGKNQDAEIKITSSNNLAPKNTFEAILYRFIAEQPRNPKDFFNQASFHAQFDEELENIYLKLEKLHLRRTPEQLESMKRIAKRSLWLIMGVGGTKFLLGFFSGRPVMFLVLSLFALFIIWIIAFSGADKRASMLGKRYLKALENYVNNNTHHLDPALKIATLGIAGLAGFAMFYAFQEAFAASATSTISSDTGGGGCGGGCSGSDGGGGGCGGCGGGGD